MARKKLDTRMRIQVELAITAGSHCLHTLARQEARARELGLTGAEIDAARAGSSFDVRIAAAVDYARSFFSDAGQSLAASASRAQSVGITVNDLSAIQTIVSKVIKRELRTDPYQKN